MSAIWVQVPLPQGRNRSARISVADDADVNRIMFMGTIALLAASVGLLGCEVTASFTSL